MNNRVLTEIVGLNKLLTTNQGSSTYNAEKWLVIIAIPEAGCGDRAVAVVAPARDGATYNAAPVARGVASRSFKANPQLHVRAAAVQARLHRWCNVGFAEEQGRIRKGARTVEAGDGKALVAGVLLLG